jgi:putative ABC transport system substrate-binding protein
VLFAGSRQSTVERGTYDAFVGRLRELGYVEGRNITIQWRFADGQYERLPDLAAELVRLEPDVIVAAPSPAIRAAQRATSTIPIVFPGTGDPVGSGFVASLARPGANVTGIANGNLEVAAKTLELLREVLPRMSTVALLANPGSSTEPAMAASITSAAQKLGVRVVVLAAGTPEAIDRAFARMHDERADAVIVGADALMNMQRSQIAQLALRHRLPSVSQGDSFARGGGLLAYGVNANESYRLAAVYVDRILRGANVAELPVEQPSKVELVVNLKTAAALGIAIPEAVLLRADEVLR